MNKNIIAYEAKEKIQVIKQIMTNKSKYKGLYGKPLQIRNR